jgi:hypothetical protein
MGNEQDEHWNALRATKKLLPTRSESDQIIIFIYINQELPQRQHLYLHGHL